MHSAQLCLRLAHLVLCQRPAGPAAPATMPTPPPHQQATPRTHQARCRAQEVTYTLRWHHSEPEGHLHLTPPGHPTERSREQEQVPDA